VITQSRDRSTGGPFEIERQARHYECDPQASSLRKSDDVPSTTPSFRTVAIDSNKPMIKEAVEALFGDQSEGREETRPSPKGKAKGVSAPDGSPEGRPRRP